MIFFYLNIFKVKSFSSANEIIHSIRPFWICTKISRGKTTIFYSLKSSKTVLVSTLGNFLFYLQKRNNSHVLTVHDLNFFFRDKTLKLGTISDEKKKEMEKEDNLK